MTQYFSNLMLIFNVIIIITLTHFSAKGKLESAVIYFTIGCLTLIVCGISYIVLVRREFALHYLKDREEKASSSSFEYGEIDDPMVIFFKLIMFCGVFEKG